MSNYETVKVNPRPIGTTARPQTGGAATWFMGSTDDYEFSDLSAGVTHQIAVVHYTVPSGGAVYITGQASVSTPTDVEMWCGSPEFATAVSHEADIDFPYVEYMQVATWSVFTDIPGGSYYTYLYIRDNSNEFEVQDVSLLALVAATGTVSGDPDVLLRPDTADPVDYYYPSFWFD